MGLVGQVTGMGGVMNEQGKAGRKEGRKEEGRE